MSKTIPHVDLDGLFKTEERLIPARNSEIEIQRAPAPDLKTDARYHAYETHRLHRLDQPFDMEPRTQKQMPDYKLEM